MAISSYIINGLNKNPVGPIQISIITSLYRSEAFLEAFLQHVAAICNPEECELLIVHNDPSEAELKLLQQFQPGRLKLVYISVKREGLYRSWNRAIEMASGRYLAVWNVDDIRTPDSLLLQRKALEKSSAVMCYGDFYGAPRYGKHQDVFYEYDQDYPAFRNQALKRHIVGCFPMWKKAIHERIGYFDEQFRLVADFDFQIRTALNYDLVKCEGITGYHLIDLPHKLSSNRFLQQKEQTVLKLRYQLYNQVLIHILPFIAGFKVYRYLNFGEWSNVAGVIPRRMFFTGKLLQLLTMPFVYGAWVGSKILVKSVAGLQFLFLRNRATAKPNLLKTG